MSKLTRRKFLTDTAVFSLASIFLGGNSAFAEWPSNVFADKNKNNVIEQLYGSSSVEETSLITFKAPPIAESGATVPVTVKTSLPNVESVSILVDENPNPLAAYFHLNSGNNGYVSTRIKLAKKSNVTAIVKANGKLYSSRRYVKVTKGGCGG